jgi:Arc/MetJ-type ribon-helix-helix transcriptional regulator
MVSMKTISLKLSDGLHAKLERAAKQEKQSKSDVVRTALEQFLNGQRKGKKFVSALDLAGDLVGCAEGPGDLSTNPKYMEGYGR